MLFKNTPQEIKDLDEKQGVVIAYANVYNNEDSDGDISMHGSFKRTVNNNRKRIRVLKDHNSTISLGVPIELDADDPYGLKTATQFNMNKEVAKDMFTDILLFQEHGLNAELSIGYEVVKRNEKNRKQIEEYKLYEYSFLTGWAANQLATVEGVKSLQNVQGIIEIIQKSYDMDYSDDRLKQIEAILKSLDGDSAEPATLPDDSISQIFDKFTLTQTLNNNELWKLKSN